MREVVFYNPWADDADEVRDPNNCYIYVKPEDMDDKHGLRVMLMRAQGFKYHGASSCYNDVQLAFTYDGKNHLFDW